MTSNMNSIPTSSQEKQAAVSPEIVDAEPETATARELAISCAMMFCAAQRAQREGQAAR